jgi:AraC-like DNA-binding protein
MLRRSSECVDSHAPDSLSEILHDLRLSGASYSRTELSSPWGIEFAPQNRAQFHFVTEGSCWLRMSTRDRNPQRLVAGDLVLFPRGASHLLSDRPRGRTTPLEELPREQVNETTNRLRNGGGGATTLLACCSFAIGGPEVRFLFELMPPALVVRDTATRDSAMSAFLDSMADEVMRPRVGAATIMARLADVVITRVIRTWAEDRSEDTSGWLAAIRDPRIGKALAAIHRQPGRAWSVEALADIAQLSRSVFSERFTSLLGTPPAQYLTRWRMQLASGWLRNEQLTVAEVAARIGYESESSFSRAFKRFSGQPPSALRRQAVEEDTLREDALSAES